MRKRVIYTREDGGVSICCPSIDCIRWMQCGGLWREMPHGFIENQIERQISAGHDEASVRRFVSAMAFGGCSTGEAINIIAERDCRHRGFGIEILDVADLPRDRWFRDAWRRSRNGGPIDIDMRKARMIQWRKLKRAVAKENRIRELDFYGKEQIKMNWGSARLKIEQAQSTEDLRRVWFC